LGPPRALNGRAGRLTVAVQEEHHVVRQPTLGEGREPQKVGEEDGNRADLDRLRGDDLLGQPACEWVLAVDEDQPRHLHRPFVVGIIMARKATSGCPV
jgi:hypothetical protein